MATSLALHIIFAIIGIALPLMMAIAEALWLRTGEENYRFLARRWAKGSAILFAVGAVSGKVLSFELGLLWHRFMSFAGAIIPAGVRGRDEHSVPAIIADAGRHRLARLGIHLRALR
jgi:cytochrome d ubiquinol oxidase subunit I